MAVRGKPRKLDSEALWQYALRVLGQRAHSANELKRKLSARAASRSDVTAAMAKLRDYGFADDTKYCEAFASSRLQNQGFGRLRVLRELRAKQVAPTIAEKAVEKTFDGIDERGLIEAFLARKYRGKNLSVLLQEPKHLASAFRKLRTAGFTTAASIAALRRYSQLAHELEDDNPSGDIPG